MKGLTTHTTIAEIDLALDIDIHILESRIFTTTDISKNSPIKAEGNKQKLLMYKYNFCKGNILTNN